MTAFVYTIVVRTITKALESFYHSLTLVFNESEKMVFHVKSVTVKIGFNIGPYVATAKHGIYGLDRGIKSNSDDRRKPLRSRRRSIPDGCDFSTRARSTLRIPSHNICCGVTTLSHRRRTRC